jgi:type II secretory pathway component HofQ
MRTGWLVLALTLLASAAQAERAVQLYRPQSRVAAELVAAAEAALGDEGSATLDPGTNALVLIGEREAVDATLALLAELDRPLRTVVLHYESERLEDLEARGVRIAWSVSAGSFRIGNVIAKPGVDRLAVRPLGVRSVRSGRLAGVLRVEDGRSGRIETGTSLPVVHDVSPWESHVDTLSASSGFEATPRIQGDGRVRVGLRPFEGSLGRGGAIHSSGAVTEVTVEPGDTVAIGGLGRSQQQRARSLGGAAKEERYEDWLLLLRVEVEGAALAAPVPGPE